MVHELAHIRYSYCGKELVLGISESCSQKSYQSAFQNYQHLHFVLQPIKRWQRDYVQVRVYIRIKWRRILFGIYTFYI